MNGTKNMAYRNGNIENIGHASHHYLPKERLPTSVTIQKLGAALTAIAKDKKAAEVAGDMAKVKLLEQTAADIREGATE